MYKLFNFIFFNLNKIYHDFFIFNLRNQEKTFYKIYKNNYWGSNISKSGPGSDLINTLNIRKKLPKIINEYKIKSIFDAPCGDFFWLSKIISNMNVKYVGADIVRELIKINQKKFGNKKIRFIKLNLVSSKYPKADLWICRALFFHLNYNSIKKILLKLKKSKFKYILITNSFNKNNFENKDIISGNYRQLDLFKKPFNFKKNYVLKFADTYFPKTNQVDQEMILWKKKDLIENLKFIL